MDNVRSYYDLFAASYLEKRSDGLMLNPTPYLKFFQAHLPAMSLVDLGCGPGFESELALSYEFAVTGIDFSPKMIELFKRKNPDAAATVADLKEIPCLSQSFDLFLSSFSLLHCEDLELTLRLKEIARIAKPRSHGLFLVACLDRPLQVEQIHREAKDVHSIYPIPFFFRTLEGWTKLIAAAGFEVEACEHFLVPGAPVRATSIFVKRAVPSSHVDQKLSTSWRDGSLEDAAKLGESLMKYSGISRLSRLDSLTDFSLPIYQGARPAAKTEVTVCGGKGMTAEESRTSALFEGMEIAAAEVPLPCLSARRSELSSWGPVVDLNSLGVYDPQVDPEYEWTPMKDLLTEREVFVPSCFVGLDNAKVPLRANTHGLASGTSFGEALLHAFLEVIERHNFSHALAYKKALSVKIEEAGDESIAALISEAARAGLKFEVKDTTWPTGIPSHFALLFNLEEQDSHLIGGGLGCHIDPRISIRRAMLEALQSRAVSVAGGREDLERQPRAQGDRFDQVRKTYEFWYAPTAERVDVGPPLIARESQSLEYLVEQLYAHARVRDEFLGRLLYYVVPSPEGTCVVRCVLEGAELFGLFPDRPGPRIKALLDSHLEK